MEYVPDAPFAVFILQGVSSDDCVDFPLLPKTAMFLRRGLVRESSQLDVARRAHTVQGSYDHTV